MWKVVLGFFLVLVPSLAGAFQVDNPARAKMFLFDSKVDLVPIDESVFLETFRTGYFRRFGRTSNLLDLHRANQALFHEAYYPRSLPLADTELEKISLRVRIEDDLLILVMNKQSYRLEFKRLQILRANPHSWIFTLEVNGVAVVLNEDDPRSVEKLQRAMFGSHGVPAEVSLLWNLLIPEALADEAKSGNSSMFSMAKTLAFTAFSVATDLGGSVGGLIGRETRKMLLTSMSPDQLDAICTLIAAPLATAKAQQACVEATETVKDARAAAKAARSMSAAVAEQSKKLTDVAKQMFISPLKKIKENMGALKAAAGETVQFASKGMKGGKLAVAASGGPVTTAIVMTIEVYNAGMALVNEVCPGKETALGQIEAACKRLKDPTKATTKDAVDLMKAAAKPGGIG